MESAWDPKQYERFKAERQQPFFDLLALVQPKAGMRVVDLGCGTGELTRILHERIQAGETLGIDNSASMLAQSAAFAADGLRFEQQTIEDFAPAEGYDLVFSNAALQWIPEHADLFRRLTRWVNPGGQLAVQVPANPDDPGHLTAGELAADAEFRDALSGHTRSLHVLEPRAYALLLDRLGYGEQHVRLQVYVHHLASREEVVEWMRGTLLTDFRRRLPGPLYQRFLQRYRERLIARLPDTRPFVFPFQRILIWAEH